MSWDLSNDRPIYLQLIEHLKRQILAGKYSSGTRFPTVRDLATEASVNPNTMQKALQELERDGLLITNRTSGRTITEDESLIQKMRIDFAHDSFLHFKCEMNQLGFSDDKLIEYIKKELNN